MLHKGLDFDSLKQRIDKRQVWIWGAKTNGIAVCAMIERNSIATVQGFIDNDPKLHNNTIRNKSVISFNQFCSCIDKQNTYIVIAANQYIDEIKQICLNYGLIEERDFCPYSEFLGVWYEIDLVSYCNLKCPSCPQGNFATKPPMSKMTLERFQLILKKINQDNPNVAYIGLFCWGDPLLHPELAEFIKSVKKYDIPCYLSSNLNTEKPLDDIINANPDYFRISASGYSQHIYEIDHKGGNVNLLKSNLYKLRYLIDKLKVDTYVEISYHKYLYNADEELKLMKNLCNELNFHFAPFIAAVMPYEHMIDIYEGRITVQLSQLINRLCFDLNKIPREDMRSSPHLCNSLYNVIPIMPDGKVLLCDYAYDLKRSCIADNFLDISHAELIKRKLNNFSCQKCLQYGIPNMYNAVIDDTNKCINYHK